MSDHKKAMADVIARHSALYPTEATGPTGPRTEDGKKRSRLNAYKHGLSSQTLLITPEENEGFEEHCKAMVKALVPIGTLEHQLARSIAEDRWRLERARAIEANIFALGQSAEVTNPGCPEIDQAVDQAKTWLRSGKQIQLLSLYEQRIQRTIEKNTAELRRLRTERVNARQKAVEEAILLAQLAKSKGETYDPAADFRSPEFDFSSAEIEYLRDIQERLEEARALPKNRNNPNPGRKMPAAA